MDSPLQSSISFAETVSFVGFALVILGVIGEGCEIALKWATSRKRLKEVFDGEYRRLILSVVWRIRHHELEYETLFFVLVVLGLGIELLGSFTAMRLQGKDNAVLHDRASKLEATNLVYRQAIIELEKLHWSRTTRLINGKFAEMIKQNPTGEAFFFFEPSNVEAMSFAVTVSQILKGFGWTVHGPASLTAELFDAVAPGFEFDKVKFELENTVSTGSMNGIENPNGMIILIGNGDSNTYRGLNDSLMDSGFLHPSFTMGQPFPTNRVIVVIGKK